MSANSFLPRGFQWIFVSSGNVPPNALVAGNDKSGEKLYIARVVAGNTTHVGKCGQHVRGALVVCDGRAQFFNNYEVLCGPSAQVSWVECVGPFDLTKVSGVPLVGGSDANGAALFITRVKTASGVGRSGTSSIGVQPGSISSLMKGAVASYSGEVYSGTKYEVLVANYDGIGWMQESNGNHPPDAILGGTEDNSQGVLYIARAFFEGGSGQPSSLQVGKTGPYIAAGSFAYDGKEVKVKNVEVPTVHGKADDVIKWVAASGQLDLGKLGATPIMAGIDVDGSILYIAQVKEHGTQPGKVSVNYKDGMQYSYGNAVHTGKDYEVLCYK